MSDIWWGYCNLRAWYSRRLKDDIEGANYLVDRLAAEQRVPLMEEGPFRFLEHVVAKFEAVIERLDQDESMDKHYAYELRGNLYHIQKMRGDVPAWAEARQAAIQARDACASG